MVQSPSWSANWFAASQEIPRISRNPKVYYCTHKNPPTVFILGQPNPVHIPTSHLLEIHSNIIHSSTPRSLQWSPSLRFPHQDPIHPPLLIASHLKILIPAGSAKIIVADVRYVCVSTSILTYLLTFSMVQSPSWEANWFAASQEIPRISRNPKVHYCTHKHPPPVSTLGQPNPVHLPPDCFVSRANIPHVSVS